MTDLAKAGALGVAFLWSAGAFALEGSAEHGKAVFNGSKTCHAAGPGARTGAGPEQNNLVGAKAAARSGRNYFPAMKEAGGKVLMWIPEKLDKYLENPKTIVPSTGTVFSGLEERAGPRAPIPAAGSPDTFVLGRSFRWQNYLLI